MVANWEFLVPIAVVGLAAGSAIFCDLFDDNLLQRVGLALVSFGSIARVYTALRDINDTPEARLIIVWGLAIYAVGSYAKYLRRWYTLRAIRRREVQELFATAWELSERQKLGGRDADK